MAESVHPEFIRASEARRALGGMDEARFYDLVGRGVIPSLQTGQRRRVFPRAFIAALARYVVHHPGASLAELDPRAVLAEGGAL